MMDWMGRGSSSTTRFITARVETARKGGRPLHIT
jgi:hypothetical protein